MAPLLPLLVVLVATGLPATLGQGEVVSRTTSRDVTRSQTSTSQSSETRQITSGAFHNTTNTSRSTASVSNGQEQQRAASSTTDGGFAYLGRTDTQLKDDNRTGPSGTSRIQSAQRTRENRLSVSEPDGGTALQVSQLRTDRDENVTLTGTDDRTGTESTRSLVNSATVTAGDGGTVSRENVAVSRSVNGSEPWSNGTTTPHIRAGAFSQ
ncbi:hypothetical protein FJT64_000911 [Amphibalanus amphitrite]|uniref:Uncharacterized protein n=1 Tax=Amphibalanus amphitrite TaxID=1232801 RepID=A0A6A4VH82_AMPAM|nr:hypothetical protein FJT64_000911 [Amphibalanus amphitrite]